MAWSPYYHRNRRRGPLSHRQICKAHDDTTSRVVICEERLSVFWPDAFSRGDHTISCRPNHKRRTKEDKICSPKCSLVTSRMRLTPPGDPLGYRRGAAVAEFFRVARRCSGRQVHLRARRSLPRRVPYWWHTALVRCRHALDASRWSLSHVFARFTSAVHARCHAPTL